MTRSCFVCEEEELVDAHHVIPVEFGGPRNGKCVDLCPRCHRLVHRNGEHLYKTGKLKGSYYKLSPREQAQALILIKYIRSAKLQFEDSGEHVAKNARNMVSISCTPEELLAFHSVKSAMGFSSLTRAIKALVLEKYQQQMGMRHEKQDSKPSRKPPEEAPRGRKQRVVRNKGRGSSNRNNR